MYTELIIYCLHTINIMKDGRGCNLEIFITFQGLDVLLVILHFLSSAFNTFRKHLKVYLSYFASLVQSCLIYNLSD